MAGRNICVVSACGQDVHSYGHCRTHYHRLKKHGDPLAGGTFKDEAWEWLKAHSTYAEAACLLWPFGRNDNGYGRLTRPGSRNKLYAHREMCRLVHGDPPSSAHQTAHSCGKGHDACVHPRHVRWDTVKGNAGDRVDHGTENRGVRNGQAKLSASDVLAIREMAATMPSRDVAREFSISRWTVRDIMIGRRWGWLV